MFLFVANTGIILRVYSFQFLFHLYRLVTPGLQTAGKIVGEGQFYRHDMAMKRYRANHRLIMAIIFCITRIMFVWQKFFSVWKLSATPAASGLTSRTHKNQQSLQEKLTGLQRGAI